MKRAVYGGIGAAVALVAILILRSAAFDATPGTVFAYHVLLSGSGSYENGTYSESFDLPAGDYAVRFIASGSSPERIALSLEGQTLSFAQVYSLQSIEHKSPISEYYTWSYEGDGAVHVPEGQTVKIAIDPYGDTDGSVSVMLERR